MPRPFRRSTTSLTATRGNGVASGFCIAGAFGSVKGRVWAHVLIDYGTEFDLCCVCFIVATGECSTFRNSDVRLAPNETLGIRCEPSVKR